MRNIANFFEKYCLLLWEILSTFMRNISYFVAAVEKYCLLCCCSWEILPTLLLQLRNIASFVAVVEKYCLLCCCSWEILPTFMRSKEIVQGRSSKYTNTVTCKFVACCTIVHSHGFDFKKGSIFEKLIFTILFYSKK